MPSSSTHIPSSPTPTLAATLPTQAEPLPCHPMITRSKNNIQKLIQKLIFTTKLNIEP
jgi:hypothetical protein